MAVRKKKRRGGMWMFGLLFAAGYLITALLEHTTWSAQAPTIATTLAVALTIPWAARTGRVWRGTLRGFGAGLAASAGIAGALFTPTRPTRLEELPAAAGLAALVTMICCTAAGALFALLAERRRRQVNVEDQ